MLGRLEIIGRWSHLARHIPGVENTPVDAISRRPRVELGRKVMELTNSNEWAEQAIGDRGVVNL